MIPNIERLLNSVLHSAPYGIMTFTAKRDDKNKIIDFEFLTVNKAAQAMVNHSAEELIGSTLLKKLPTNKEVGLFDKYCHVVETGDLLSLDQHYKGEDLDSWFRIKAEKLEDGFVVSFIDITEFKSRTKELERSEARYRKLFFESMDAIFIVNNELLFMEINDATAAMFGYSLEQIRLITLKDLFKEEQDFWRFNQEFYKKDRVEEFEAELISVNTKVVHCIINLVNLSPDEDMISSYQGVIKDVTRKKKADQEILWAEKLSMTGKIARSIAHEVRNPLTNLSLALEQLKDEVPEDIEDAELYFNIIKRNADRIGTLVTELLDSSKPKSLQLKGQSLNDVVLESMALVSDRIKLQNMTLVQNYHTSLPMIALDRDQIKIALLNIFINAIEAMKPDIGELRVTTYQEENEIVLEVSDNGKGIPKENLGKLFEPFFTAKKGGMGLGLTTFQNIIQSHLGKVRVTSELGFGTSFFISFPI
ncbi:MAG: PAS domain S-box-containing protein [Roseivirga sp.]|jgi:PAS domain S-box-containing protein